MADEDAMLGPAAGVGQPNDQWICARGGRAGGGWCGRSAARCIPAGDDLEVVALEALTGAGALDLAGGGLWQGARRDEDQGRGLQAIFDGSGATEEFLELQESVCATLRSDDFCVSQHFGHTFESPSYPAGFSCSTSTIDYVFDELSYPSSCSIDYDTYTESFGTTIEFCAADVAPFCDTSNDGATTVDD